MALKIDRIRKKMLRIKRDFDDRKSAAVPAACKLHLQALESSDKSVPVCEERLNGYSDSMVGSLTEYTFKATVNILVLEEGSV